ncbi:MAG: hypothetical protein R6X15_07240 [Pseudomonadota bacterium]
MNIGKNAIQVPALLFLFSPAVSNASLSNGNVINLSRTSNIPFSQPVSINLQWSMVRTTASGGEPGLTVSSVAGQFTDATGQVLGTVPRVLSKSQPITLSDTSFTFRETLNIPREVLYRAYQQNLSEIYYRRDFTDCPGVECSTLAPAPSLVLRLSGSMDGAFRINRLQLRFKDGSSGAIIRQGQALRAEARLEAAGTGVLKGVWEVATPATTVGVPVFTPLQMVNRRVSSARMVRITSPELPSAQPGNYLIRFRLTEPATSQAAPTLQYAVTAARLEELPGFGLREPSPGTAVDGHTRFRWQPVSGASSYKLEVIDERPEESGKPVVAVTGILVKGSDTNISLTPSLLGKLQSGKTYWWHVLALTKDGQVIAASEWGMIKAAH